MRALFASTTLFLMCNLAACQSAPSGNALSAAVDLHKAECSDFAAMAKRDEPSSELWSPLHAPNLHEARRLVDWNEAHGEGSLRLFSGEVRGHKVVQEIGFFTDASGQAHTHCLTAMPNLEWLPDSKELLDVVGSNPDRIELWTIDEETDPRADAFWYWTENPFQGDRFTVRYSETVVDFSDADVVRTDLPYPGLYMVTEAPADNLSVQTKESDQE